VPVVMVESVVNFDGIHFAYMLIIFEDVNCHVNNIYIYINKEKIYEDIFR
jgi:hypothetical protein